MLLISGFADLIEKKNFISAVSLIRLHFDSLLQFYAVFLVNKPHEYARKKLNGKHTRELKDRNNIKMTD